MEFKFYGGAQEVGRSAILMKDERNILFDFGVKVDHKMDFPTSIPKADLLLLSHAHLDHSGFSPGLYTEMQIPTFGTPPTLRLSNLLLDDSIGIAQKQHLKPRFHRRQIQDFVNKYIQVDYHHVQRFGNYDVEFYDAGHIAGSSITLVERVNAKDYKRVVYTGDFKLDGQFLHKGAEVVKSDVLIIESTYANREHPDREMVVSNFVERVKTVVDNGGTALIPAFAVGRSQELLALLHENKLAHYAYLDGMSKDATQIVMNYPKFISNPGALQAAAREVTWINDRKERKDALEGGSIVLTTSGMLNGGPVLDYITKLNKESQIFLTGFQQEGTNGRLLLDKGCIMEKGAKRRIDQPVDFYDFSAHAGMTDLHNYVKESDPHVVICVHGDGESTKEFADSLKAEGFEAHAPKIGDTIKIGK